MYPTTIRLISLFTILACLHWPERSYSQQITISKKNAPLQELFLDIYKQSGYFFYYRNELLLNAKKVTIEVKNASLERVLAICFRDQPLTYKLSNRVIVVQAKDESRTQKARDAEVHGRVLDEQGQPVAGVTVSVKGTKTGASTDADGRFSIKTGDGQPVLLFTSTNMEPAELPLNGRVDVLITLKTKITGLQDVVVNKGYYSSSQRLNTGSVSMVKSADIEKQPVSNPLEAIEGRMPGVYVQQTSGVSGSGLNIEIRGRNSLRNSAANNGNLPFYIVDGVPISSSSLDQSTSIAGLIAPQLSPLNSLSPSDIESITILKDADATAIYGSRGANGVVLITTKKGKAGKTKVGINLYTGAGNVTRLMHLLNTQEYLEMRHEAFRNDDAVPQYYDYDLNGSWDTTRYTDWQKTLIGGISHISNIQASLSGGNQNTQFLFGGNYFRESTVFRGNFADAKSSAHINLNHNSENKKLTASVSASYTADNNNLPNYDPTASALNLVPVAPPTRHEDGTLNWADGSWQNFTNPLAAFLQPYTGNTSSLIANAVIGYQLIEGLEIKTSLGFNNTQIQQTGLTPISAQDPAYSPTGFGNFATNSYSGWIIEPQASYQTNWLGGKISALIGSTFQQNISQAQSFLASGFTSDALLENLLAAPNLYATVFNYAKYKYNALFGRVNYNWKDRYLVNLTGRRDGSSRFGPGKQFADFGAVGLGWVFSNEPFVRRSLSILSFGKIRGSYGTTGSDQIGDYGYLDTYAATSFPYNGTGGLLINRLFNPNYAWETNKKIEISLETGFLKDRILFNISYYRNQSSNQLIGYPLPAITGQSSLPFYNLPATVRNSGWEFDLSSTLIDRQLKWTSSVNLSVPRNMLVSYPGLANSSYANTYTVGRSLYTRKAFHSTGIDAQNGTYQFEDADKDGQISDPNDLLGLKEIGREYFGGILNSLSYGSWQLDIFFQFVKQTGINYLSSFQSPGTLSNEPLTALSRWQKAVDQPAVQKFSQDYGSAAGIAYGNVQNSDRFITDASFIRLKNLALSYRLRAHVLAKLKMDNCRIFIQGQNLITITHYLGLDPETQSFQSLPPLKMLTAGLSIIL